MNSKHKVAYQRIGLNILYLRKERKLTQERLAELTGYSRNHIQRIETGTMAPSIDSLLDIADILGVTTGSLIDSKLG